MFKKVLILLTGLGLLNANPLSVETISKILEYSKNVFYKRAEVLVNFEYNNRIGATWFEMGEENGAETYNFNYMRFDSTGKGLVDMRNFKIKPAHLDKYGIDWELSIPTLNYIPDEKGNSWLIYSYDTISVGWQIGWVKVDSIGKIVEDKSAFFHKPQYIFAYPDDKLGFHLYCDFKYYNPQLEEPVRLSNKFSHTKAGIELQKSRSLLIVAPNAFNRRIGSDFFEYRIISDKGKVIKEKTLEWKPFVARYWEDVELPCFYETFKQDSVIYCLFPYKNKINLITFTAEGKAIKPDKCVEGPIMEIDRMPKGAKRFMKIYKGTIFYFGLDNEGNLYYWSSKETEK